jgi:hypothetical protein
MHSLILGSFAVAPSGTLTPRVPGLQPELRFAWRGRPCRAALMEDELHMAAIAARIPSTADPMADRPGALAALALLPEAIPEGWRLSLLPDHRICLETREALEAPPTAVTLVTRLVRFALALDPYLERLEAAGTDLPGTVNT